jgi:hypothetical protein
MRKIIDMTLTLKRSAQPFLLLVTSIGIWNATTIVHRQFKEHHGELLAGSSNINRLDTLI